MGSRVTTLSGTVCLRIRESKNPQPLGLHFRALLTESGTKVCFH